MFQRSPFADPANQKRVVERQCLSMKEHATGLCDRGLSRVRPNANRFGARCRSRPHSPMDRPTSGRSAPAMPCPMSVGRQEYPISSYRICTGMPCTDASTVTSFGE